MEILQVSHPNFKAYGRVITGIDVSDLLDVLRETPKPEDVVYVASDAKLEACESAKKNCLQLVWRYADTNRIL